MSNDPAPGALLPMIPTTESLEDWDVTPAWIHPTHEAGMRGSQLYSCCFCGVGDSGEVSRKMFLENGAQSRLTAGEGVLSMRVADQVITRPVRIAGDGTFSLTSDRPLCRKGGVISARISCGGHEHTITAREESHESGDKGLELQFRLFARAASIAQDKIDNTSPTPGCVKLRLSTGSKRPVYPIHTAPSVLQADGSRTSIGYAEAIDRFADLLLKHRGPTAKTLIYASGQIDYFAIFAMQETYRLLGIRNLTGNAEHCLNAGAVHNEILTGQEGPFLTLDQAVNGPNRIYLFNGWNGFITHPPVFANILKRPDFDAFLVEVMVTESAKAIAKKLGPERILLIRPRSDPQLALSVAHEILTNIPEAVEQRFISQFSDGASFEQFKAFALQARFSPDRVAQRIAPEPEYVERLLNGIRHLARSLAHPDSVPINLPSVGLSQTSGVVAHCLWGGVLAMLGKYGLRPDGTPAGGTLRVPGQINAQSEVQGLSRKYFMGRVPIADAAEAARRMGLPEDSYQGVVDDEPRAALDYSEPTSHPELMICFGTQFEANMMGRNRWLAKLRAQGTTLVVVDPIPDPFTLDHADLIIPSPPHVATAKLYQNGEWKIFLSVPQKKAAPQTRSDATILYDCMQAIANRFEHDADLAASHPDLMRHIESGYWHERFCAPKSGGPGLHRVEGEVSRPQLWERIQAYMQGGTGPLYCAPEHTDGRPVSWKDLLHGPVIYGGVGTNRFMLDYDDASAVPFRDVYRRPGKFRFFLPKAADIEFASGIILNSGRSPLSDEREKIQFATSTFNSGKATPATGMPDDNPLHVSPGLAERVGLKDGGHARIINRISGDEIVLPVIITDRVKGDTVYSSFHKSRALMDADVCINTVTSHEPRCDYSGQTRVKATEVLLEAADAPRLDTTVLDPGAEIAVWNGDQRSLYVTDKIQETHDVFTYRFQGRPFCRFVYYPGQFATLAMAIDGKKVVRSYSISSSPARPYSLEITVKRVPGGIASNWLADNLHIGDRIDVSGPRGHFKLVPGSIARKILLIGAGSGVTPMMSMARWLCDVAADVDIRFFNSVRSTDDIVYREEIDHLAARHRQFHPVVITSTRGGRGAWTGMTGRISRAMLELAAPDLFERHVYMCGPEGFMDAAKNILADAGFNMANLHSESFGGVRTSVKAQRLPGAEDSSDGDDTSGHIDVEFSGAGKVVKTNGRMTLLELAEANDVAIDYACRAGSCGACKVKLLKGEVDAGDAAGLDAADKQCGYVLSCVALPKGPCTLDC